MLNVSELNLFNTRSFLLQTVGFFAQIQTLVHQSFELKSSNGGQDQVLKVNLISLGFIRYYFSEFHLRFSFAFSCSSYALAAEILIPIED
jgi:hypothetical protein